MFDEVVGWTETTNDRHEVPAALAEPTVHVRAAWIAGLSLASLGMWIATLTPLQMLLPLQLQSIAPEHKIVALGLVSAAGALSASTGKYFLIAKRPRS